MEIPYKQVITFSRDFEVSDLSKWNTDDVKRMEVGRKEHEFDGR